MGISQGMKKIRELDHQIFKSHIPNRRNFSNNPTFFSKELKFIHITKCAGTAIEEAGKKIGIKWGKYHCEYYKPCGGFWHKPFLEVADDVKRKYDWFVVVRNPYDRILSEYYCEWGGNGKNITHSVEDFNSFLIKKIIQRASHPYTGHFVEQYKYIDYITKIHIIKYENLDAEFNALMKMYNINNITLEKTNTVTENNINTTLFTVKDFSEELIKTINLAYEKDFDAFGYIKALL